MANLSDIGLNLSDITNCLNVFVTDESEFSPDILQTAVSIVAEITAKEDFPVLLETPAVGQYRAIGSGHLFAAAIRYDGSIACWGNASMASSAPSGRGFSKLGLCWSTSNAIALRGDGMAFVVARVGGATARGGLGRARISRRT